MSDGLPVHAEILKLARLLERDPATLEYLDQLPADELRMLRGQATDVMFDAHGKALARLATASKVLPTGLIATLAQRAFGPVLAARVAGLLEPGRAAEVADKLPDEFLADVAIALDPRRASAVIARIPPRRIGAVGRELLRREDYITLGRFVGYVGDEGLRAALEPMDGRALVQVAVVLEDTDQLEHVINLLSPSQLDDAIERAREAGLLAQLGPLASTLPSARAASS